MGLFSIFGKKDVNDDITKAVPFRMTSELVPYKLYSNKSSSAMLMVKVKNLTHEVLLTSVVAELPINISFDEMGMSKQREIRIGELAPQEEKQVRFDVHSGLKSEKGEYTMTLTAIVHYRDYGHVLNAVKKRATINVV
ncbi:MAG TPA: hypothetical protein VND15_03830 [Candidatus Acidoferrales bacterium]|nr:hypothetical protein [Candidatus Acidoferrales bacterium]